MVVDVLDDVVVVGVGTEVIRRPGVHAGVALRCSVSEWPCRVTYLVTGEFPLEVVAVGVKGVVLDGPAVMHEMPIGVHIVKEVSVVHRPQVLGSNRNAVKVVVVAVVSISVVGKEPIGSVVPLKYGRVHRPAGSSEVLQVHLRNSGCSWLIAVPVTVVGVPMIR